MQPGQSTQEIAATKIEDFVRQIGTIASDDPGFHRQADLFDAGYVDSLALVALTAFIEETFHLSLTEQDLFHPEFTTIDGMARLITTRIHRSCTPPHTALP
ncbi:acyl carrier protein [Sphaerisporangium sp. NPDC049002]|uniref:acyl carrier protein n=1 Tax=unclassified Sphaerisporangium TaxID=2630420 RepID=UPI0033E9107B